MTDYRVEYIVKPNHLGRIQALGGNSPRAWRDTEDNVIKAMQRGDKFHVLRGGYRADLMVEWGHGSPYLKTVPDGTRLDNLLSLPNVA